MKSRNLIFVLLGVVVLIVLLRVPRETKTSPHPIRIGAILPLTGPAASFGQSSRNALLLAEDELNSSPTERKCELLVEDGMTDPKTSVSAFNRLYDTQGVRLFITTVSSVSLALAPLADSRSSTLFANASHPELTTGRQYVFRYSNTANDEATTLSSFLLSQQWPRIFAIALNDEYGRAYVTSLEKALPETSSITFLGKEYYDRSLTDFRTLLTKALSRNPDAFVLIGFGRSMGLCLRQLRELGYDRPYVASLGLLLTTDAITAAGEALRGGYLLNYAFQDESAVMGFREKYRSRFGTDPSPNALIDYSTIHLLMMAARNTTGDPTQVRDYLRTARVFSLPTGDVTISPQGDVVVPVRVVRVPPTGAIDVWAPPGQDQGR